MELTPTEALVRDRRRRASASPVDAIAPGAVIVVKPGEKLPLDGEVVAGTSAVNQAPVTGESLPVDKAAWRRGVRRQHQRPRRARRPRDARSAATPRSRASSTSSSRRRRSARPSQTFVERFARVYTPAVLVLAVAGGARAAAASAAATGRRWIYRALVLLVVVLPVRARHLDARCRSSPRWPARRARACSSRAARTSSAPAGSAASPSTRPAR